MVELETLLYGGIGALSSALAVSILVLGSTPPTRAPHLGLRGLKRHRALERGGIFALLEPAMRLAAGWTRLLPLGRRRIERLLVRSGDYLGLTADEFHALCLLGAVGGFGLGSLASWAADLPAVTAGAGAGIGLFLPYFLVSEEIDRRRCEISRGLPGTIEITALCMGAGLDFPGSLEQVIAGSESDDDPLLDELQLILHSLQLGHTRRRALQTFAERVDSDEVRDFVGAVVQAEERGTPLAEVLRIQAGMLRLRRSIRADRVSSRAAILMILGPLVLLFISIMLLIVGPLILQTISNFSAT
jgi:tight adherence protein C